LPGVSFPSISPAMTALDLSSVATEIPRGPTSIFALSRAEIAARIAEGLGLDAKKAKMRASQLWRWVYHYGLTDFEAMTDIGREMRAGLARLFSLARPRLVERQISTDGTRKYLIEAGPGALIECVYIPDVGRAGALCVSSQVGCTLNCTFCHTGTQALVRNLTAGEIVAQVMAVKDDLGEWPSGGDDRRLSNIVFMGMGEPLYNFDNVARAIATIADGDGIGISRRRITVSTSGVVPEIERLGEVTGAMLAISLHATTDALRDVLVPINRKYPIAELLEACRAYPAANNSKRITFEYVMLKGVNDTDAEAHALVRLLKNIHAKINLIPFNPWPGAPYECSDWARIEAFAEIVNKAGYASPIRTPRGRDISAACGQLKSESVKVRASERMRTGG